MEDGAELLPELLLGEGVPVGVHPGLVQQLLAHQVVAHLVGGVGEEQHDLFGPPGKAPEEDGKAVAAEDGEHHADGLPAQPCPDVGGDLVHGGVVAPASVTATTSFSPMGICSAARAETTVSATMAARSSPSRMMGARTPRTTVPNILSINKGPLSDFPPGGGHFIHNGIIIIENRRQVKKSPAPFLRAGAVFLLFLRGFGP